MSWKHIAVLALMVVSSVIFALTGHEQLATALASGALGYAAPDRTPWPRLPPVGANDDAKQ